MNKKIEVYSPIDFNCLFDKLANHKKENFYFLAGGTDLFSMINRGILSPGLLINLNSLKPSLDFINIHSSHIEIGALTTIQKIIDYPAFTKGSGILANSIYKALGSIGSVQIRNLATLAGNIANASPAADSIPALLVEKSKINLLSKKGKRKINIDKFYTGYKKTVLKQNEIIYSIELDINRSEVKSDFIKIGTRSAMTISKLSFAYNLSPSLATFAAGSVSPFPQRLSSLEKQWFNPNLTRRGIEKILNEEISPIDDIRSTAHYRIKVMANIIYKLYQNNHFLYED